MGGPHGEVSRDARVGREPRAVGRARTTAPGNAAAVAIVAGNVEMARSHARVPPFSLSTDVRRDAQSLVPQFLARARARVCVCVCVCKKRAATDARDLGHAARRRGR